MTSAKHLPVVVTLAFSLFGCAVRNGQLPEHPALESEGRPKKVISLQVSGDVFVDGKPGIVHPHPGPQWTKETFVTYQDSGLFSQVIQGTVGGDLSVDVRVVENLVMANPLLGAFSLLTLFMIPMKSGFEYEVTTTFKDTDGNSIATITKKEGYTSWAWLPLLPALIFRAPSPSAMGVEILHDLSRATLQEAVARKVL